MRRINFEHIANFRDLGGLPTASGYACEGKLYRSSMLYNLSKVDQATFESLNIQTIMDLRSPKEIKNEVNPYKDLVKNYYHFNLSGRAAAGRSSELAKNAKDKYFMAERYMEYLEQKQELRSLFNVFLQAEAFPLVFHCSAGKDRTGTIAYLIEKLNQVPLADIVADYQVSYTYVQADPKIIHPDKGLNIYQSYPEIMQRFDAYFLDQYGSITNYFEELGFDSAEIEELSHILE